MSGRGDISGTTADDGATQVQVRSDDVVWQLLDDEVVVLDLRTSRYLSLNDAGAVLWQAMADRRRVDDLVQVLVDRYEIGREQAAADVAAFVEALRDKDLLQSPS